MSRFREATEREGRRCPDPPLDREREGRRCPDPPLDLGAGGPPVARPAHSPRGTVAAPARAVAAGDRRVVSAHTEPSSRRYG